MNWRLERTQAGIARLHLDKQDSGTNVLSSAVLAEFEEMLTSLESAPPRVLIVLSDKPNGFIAGADIRELRAFRSPREALELIQTGDALLDRLEALACPTVAVIHGFCLGGGLEFALACRYRVAADDSATRIGLPEIRLGIHPGLGGTWRLPRVAGDLPALRLMLTGKLLKARQALQIGAVDRLAPRRALLRAAEELAFNPSTAVAPRLWGRVPRPLRRWVAGPIRRAAAKKANPAHYPAPAALIELWEATPQERQAAVKAEAASMARLLFTPTARNLMRLFSLEEKLKAYGKGSPSGVRHVHVVGAGTMGAAIAAWCALKGFTVSLSDFKPEILARAVVEAGKLFASRLDARHERVQAFDRLIPDPKNDGLARADLVIEAIVENAAAKRALFAAIEPRMKPGAILASNTSAIPIEILAEGLNDPRRLAGMHFFNPVSRVRLIEVARGRQTDEDVHRRLTAFAVEIERLPLPVKSSPGFLVNRCLLPYLLEAVLLESEGVPAAAIDRAATDFGMPMGPLGLGDLVGLDVCLDVARELQPAGVPERLERLVAAGKLGIKSGEGFYRYRHGKPVVARTRSRSPAADLSDRMILRMLNEAVSALREAVVVDADCVDAGMVFAAGVAPHRGGPMAYLESLGSSAVRENLERLARRYGQRFTPDPGWSLE